MGTTAEKLNYTKTQINRLKNLTDETILENVVDKIEVNYSENSSSSYNYLNLRTLNLTNGQGLFAYLPATVQTDSDFLNYIKNIDVSNMTTFSNMFYNDANMKQLILNIWNTESVTNVGNAFMNCSSLELLNLANWNTKNVTNFNSFLTGCRNLTEIEGIINLQNATTVSGMFGTSSGNSCSKLQTIYLKNLNVTGLNLQYCTSLTHDSLMYLINNLVQTTTPKTLILGATNLAKLTDEEKVIAVEKGWTLA